MKTTALALIAGSLLMSAPAHAQNTGDFNGGFEQADAVNPGLVANWRHFNGANRRSTGDGLTPEITARSGVGVLELPPGADFCGADTNSFRVDIFTFNDPAYVYGCGLATVTGYYYIPSSAPLAGLDNGGQSAGLKFEFRRSNSSIYLAFEDLSISGDTADQWVPFTLSVSEADFQRLFDDFNMGDPFPDFPVSVSVLPFRFGDDSDTGVVFWDDVEYTQREYDPADVTETGSSNGLRDGVVDLSDFSFYLGLWSSSDAAADVTTDGTSNGIPDGSVTLSDFSFYLSLWSDAGSSVEPSCF